ncbi:MAG: elongation factor P [Deltaproteobacteria bacterium]|nr:elongation factor P [Deltaproteobacteria bacterium]
MIQATQVRPGMIIVHGGELYRVLKIVHITQGNKRGKVQTELRNIKSGTKIENRFRSEDSIENATLEEKEMEYLYHEGDRYTFMDTQNYEQIELDKDLLGDGTYFLKSNIKIMVQFWEENPVGIDLPPEFVLEVVETDPPIKGATAASSYKPALMDNGLTVKVPSFINRGDKIKIDTASLEYLERA